MQIGSERRQHERYLLPSMYTAIDIRPGEEDEFRFSGHAYDLSVGGMRFELDEPIEPGTEVGVRITLPGAEHLRPMHRKPIYALATVVWVEQDDLESGGPVRMACVFKTFCQLGDKERLEARLKSGRYSLAA